MIRCEHAGGPASGRSTLVLIHGALGTPQTWQPILSQLTASLPDVSIYTMALPGHGPSPLPMAPGTGFGDACAAAIDALPNAGRLLIVGYSMGARLGLGMVLQSPSRFAAAMLIGVNPGIEDREERARRQTQDRAGRLLLLDKGLEVFVSYWESLPLFATQSSLPQTVLDEQRRNRLKHSAGPLAASLRVLSLSNQPCWWSALAECEVPLLVATGALDEKFAAIGRRMAGAAKIIEYVEIPEAGHNPVLEKPLDTGKLIVKFTTRHG